MSLTNKDIRYLFVRIAIICVVTVCLWFVYEPLSWFALAILSLALMLWTQLSIFRKIKAALWSSSNKVNQNCKQVEALFSLFTTIQPRMPIPPMMHGPIPPDAGNFLITTIKENKPAFILEAGSGVSTLIAGYCCEKFGAGQVVSLEHQAEYNEITQELVQQHGLDSYASVIYAPLIQYKTDLVNQPWYDISNLNLTDGCIDFLIVDGPPRTTSELARYPALPLLYKYLNNNAVIFLDDYNRADEQQIVRKWLEQFEGLEVDIYDTAHGTAILTIEKP